MTTPSGYIINQIWATTAVYVWKIININKAFIFDDLKSASWAPKSFLNSCWDLRFANVYFW